MRGVVVPARLSQNKGLGEMVRDYIFNNLISVFWSGVLLIGGLVLIRYCYTISFIPDYDFQSGVVVLAALAAIAIPSTFAMMFILIMPGVMWNQCWAEKNPLKLNGNYKTKLPRAFWLFFVPVLFWAALISAILWQLKITPYDHFLFAVFIAAVCVIVYSIRLACFLNPQQEKTIKGKLTECRKELKQVVVIHAIALYCAFILLCLIALLLSRVAKPENWGDWFVLAAVVAILLFVNMLLTLVDDSPKKQLVAFLVAGSVALCSIWWGLRLNFSLPDNVMRFYQLGQFYAESMIFKQPACKTLKYYNLKPEMHGDQCVLTHIKVLSRLGKSMYLSQDGINFTISSSDVVSWSVLKEKDKKPKE